MDTGVRRKKRRTVAETARLHEFIHQLVVTEGPLPAREVFQRLVERRVLTDTESEYRMVRRILRTMRPRTG